MIATELTDELILTCLRQVIDPELGCNIVDLGLVYGVGINGEQVSVKLTLTTQGCPMHESIAAGVKNAVSGLGVEEPTVELVWDPPWSPSMMSEHGRAALGIYDC